MILNRFARRCSLSKLVYCFDGQSSKAVIKAGRHCVEMLLRMNVMAVGVKGLLSMSKDSFVVCAFKRAQASESRRRGFGGLEISDGGDASAEVREVWNEGSKASKDLTAMRRL